MKCLIRQPAGVGDIFFCQKIAYHYYKKGYEIIWPVKKEFIWLKDRMRDFYYILETDDFEGKEIYENMDNTHVIDLGDFVFVPLHGHGRQIGPSIMLSKYHSLNIDWSDWLNYFQFDRDFGAELDLFYIDLGIKEGEEYNFVNHMFASPPDILTKEFEIPNDLRNIELRIIEGYTLIDWCFVLQNATNIYTVETSLNYLIEKLHMKAKEMVMYSKWNPPHFRHVDMLFKKNWVYIK